MIYIDLLQGKPAIDWQRYEQDRARNHHTSSLYRFTRQAIASLDGSPNEKLQQLEKLLVNEPILYSFAASDNPEIENRSIDLSHMTSKYRRLKRVSGKEIVPLPSESSPQTGKYACRVQWFEKKGYGVADSMDAAKTNAQIDLLSILCQHPYDYMSESKRGKTWDEYYNEDY